jgi:hypothetical protein
MTTGRPIKAMMSMTRSVRGLQKQSGLYPQPEREPPKASPMKAKPNRIMR